ncbi:hypothetical protein [Nostoc sp. NIES-3756]|uniref:hypothetical protein n=1 Tax=Nostoc sp. NIES-3756 TaxID=1751286 RepID=UPI000A434FC6|nr:hypothetical protein [Nostoc sp. NIES-3756]
MFTPFLTTFYQNEKGKHTGEWGDRGDEGVGGDERDEEVINSKLRIYQHALNAPLPLTVLSTHDSSLSKFPSYRNSLSITPLFSFSAYDGYLPRNGSHEL